MGIIRVLDRQVAELIAAGEVVERPASIVKELVENSLDAGATHIVCEIKGGGISYIRITDNGSGIAREDIPNAFVRHATSKVFVQEDLDKIGTFGFRGEALASIAAMCQVELVSRTKEETIGSRYVIEGSENGKLFDIGCPVGTTIAIRNVFFNTPARLKFLKKDSYEGSNVANVLEKLAVVNVNVSFKLIRDGNVVLNTPGNGDLLSTIHSIMGADFAKNLIAVDYSESAFQVKGYVTMPAQAKATRATQSFFINSRYVRSKCCTAALEEAFKGSILGGKFPGCILNVVIPVNTVDVNVHPAKIEVRFSDENAIYHVVYSGCKFALQKFAQETALRSGVSSLQPPSQAMTAFELKDFDYGKRQTALQSSKTVSPYRYGEPVDKPLKSEDTKATLEVHQTIGDYGKISFKEKIQEDTAEKQQESLTQKLLSRATTAQKLSSLSQEETTQKENLPPQNHLVERLEEKPLLETVRVIGELFTTYILVEKGNTLILIDKHAAHEKYLYDQIKNSTEVQSQTLLTPIVFATTPEIKTILCQHFEKLKAMGFSVDNFGERELVVREIPSMLAWYDVEETLEEISQKLGKTADIVPKSIDECFHSIACRAAIKGGTAAQPLELEYIVKMVQENGEISYCPHGRPVMVEISKTKLERMFGRIV